MGDYYYYYITTDTLLLLLHIVLIPHKWRLSNPIYSLHPCHCTQLHCTVQACPWRLRETHSFYIPDCHRARDSFKLSFFCSPHLLHSLHYTTLYIFLLHKWSDLCSALSLLVLVNHFLIHNLLARYPLWIPAQPLEQLSL